MDLVPTPTFTKKEFQTTVKLPPAKDAETTYPFQWLVYKPQAHAVEPFRVNEPTRSSNHGRADTSR